MSWKRGDGDTDLELSKVQSWIERADIDLYGPDGDSGIVTDQKNQKARKAQRDEDLGKVYRIVGWVGVGSIISLILSALRAFNIIH